MSNQDTVWIVVAVVVAIVVVVGLALIARNRRTHKRREEVRHLRAEIEADTGKVEKREALAAETEARARAAEAEAEAKVAEARRLRERATTHGDAAAATREELDEKGRHADRLDPDLRTDGGKDGAVDETAERADRADGAAPATPAQHDAR